MVILKILKDFKLVYELPHRPKDFDCTVKAGKITLNTPNGSVDLSQYDDDRARQIANDLLKAYLAGDDSFNLP